MATVRDAATVLRDEVGVTNVENVVRAYPRALLSDRESLLRPLDVLRERAGVDEADLASLVEAFPLLFGLDDAMGPVLDFWLDELKINAADVPRICRAFPSLLGVDVATMRANVKFLEEIGVVNTARFVTRLPPVLAYDVDRDLRPKMAELVKCALSVYDVDCKRLAPGAVLTALDPVIVDVGTSVKYKTVQVQTASKLLHDGNPLPRVLKGWASSEGRK